MRETLSRGGPVGGLLLMCAAMTFLSPHFLAPHNLTDLGTRVAVVAILALGQTFVIVSGGIDLSVGSVLGLAGVVFGWATAVAGLPLPVGILLGLGAGALAGLVNGSLVAFGNLPPFIATLAMFSAAHGLALVISGGIPLALMLEVRDLGGAYLLGFVPLPVALMVVMWALTVGVLRGTYAGRCVYAIGSNEEVSRLSGINVERQKLLYYTLSGLFAAVAGVLLTVPLASALPQSGFTFELDSIAAVLIGGASLSGGIGSASGTMVGALVVGVLRNGLDLLDVAAFWQQVVIGAVIALAAMTDTLRRRKA